MQGKPVKTALIVVDVQNDFVTGAMKIERAEEIVPLINSVRSHFDVVVFSKDWHPHDHCSFKTDEEGTPLSNDSWAAHCVQNTVGAELHPDLIVTDKDIIVTKGECPDTESYSAFGDTRKVKTEMENELHREGVTDVYVCGLATDYCVYHTAADAVEAGFKTFYLPDLSRGTDTELMQKRCDKMQELGIGFVSLDQLPSKRPSECK